MTRSIWKGPFVDPSLFKPFDKVWSRRSMVIPSFVGKEVRIYTGKAFLRVKITEQMVGHKLGEFASTRKRPIHKKKTKK